MPWIDSLDWSDLNSLRKYPIRDGFSAVSIDETFSIPDSLIVDFSLSATTDVTRRFYISSVQNNLNSLTITVSDFFSAVVGTFTISAATHTYGKDYYMTASADYVGASGKITIGSLEGLQTQPAGLFQFNEVSTELEPRTIIPGLQGIDRISFVDADNGRVSLTGDVTLISRSYLKFSYEDEIMYLDAGDPLGLSKQCATSNCVKSINGVVPDPNTGDVGILGINCISISSPAQYTLEMKDTCCQPCSGCNDLEVLTQRLTSLENRFLELKVNYTNVNTQLVTYLTTTNSNCACPS
jgi:hypothetical protein